MNYIRVGISVQATVCQYIPSVSLQFGVDPTGKEAMPTSGQQKESNDKKEATVEGSGMMSGCVAPVFVPLYRDTHTPGRFSV